MIEREYPSLYEINTRVWLRQFDQPQHRARLTDVPTTFWDELRASGIDYVWMMGIWQTVSHEQVLHYALAPGLQRDYKKVLPGWTTSDVIGSPYAIDRYQPAAELGSWEELAALRTQLHERGLRLILDFVPNHFHAESSLIDQHHYLFLSATETQLKEDPATFYRYKDHIWAHGRDPYFPAWQDTIQVDYFSNQARDFMSDQLLHLAGVCDGVRCDMAMLMINTVFESTWRHTKGFEDRNTEFWGRAIARVKKEFPDFRFIAEAYWDLEWQLQLLGFDYTYDKRLLDRLHEGNVPSVRGHLFADPDFRDRSVRFLENHDEDRVLKRMSSRQAEAAAIITYTLPGMRFFHHGQWEGKRIRLPVQLGREPIESPCTCIAAGYLDQLGAICSCIAVFYQKLLSYLQEPIFRHGHWIQLEVAAGSEHILAWQWTLGAQRVAVLVNYSQHSADGLLPGLELEGKTVREPWKAKGQESRISTPLSLSMYPYEYRILEWEE